MFTLCIPTMDRFDKFLINNLPRYIDNEYINEIIISDENGRDIEKIKNHIPSSPKLKLFKNETTLGPLFNKLKACSLATNEWIALIDSDNFADTSYFKTAKEYIQANIKDGKNVILSPSKARPNFDYTKLIGHVFKKGSFKAYNDIQRNHSLTETMMNTGNYVINKHLIDNLNLEDEMKLGIQTNSPSCDVIYLNTLMFEQLDLHLHVVGNLEYDHVVHDGSIYINTYMHHQHFSAYVHNRYRNLP